MDIWSGKFSMSPIDNVDCYLPIIVGITEFFKGKGYCITDEVPLLFLSVSSKSFAGTKKKKINKC